MTLLATLFPLLCWLAYNYGVPLLERKRPSLCLLLGEKVRMRGTQPDFWQMKIYLTA